MMVRHDVYVGPNKAGILEQKRSRLTFTYGDDYRASAEPTPLSLSMPITGRQFSGKVVDAFLWGLLPDNDTVLQRWAKQFQVSLVSPIGVVSAVGRDLPGAVSVVPSGKDVDFAAGAVTWLDETEVETLLSEVRKDQTAWLGGGRWSLAGAQAKIALLETEKGWGRPTGAVGTNRILKPAIQGLADHDINEHQCLAAARKLGLRAATSNVRSFGAERAIVVDRFDRRTDMETGNVQRLHQEDMCQALGVHPANKYQNEGGPSASDIVRLIRENVDPGNQDTDNMAFVDALILNWLIAAPDAHAKNYSVLLHGSGVRFAPLYDIASSLLYPEFFTPKVKMAMKIGRYYRAGVIGATAWKRLAEEADISADRVVERARDLSENVGDAFADVVDELESDEAVVAKDLAGRVAEWAAACRKRL